ncbi:tubulin-like doman-containing protein [Blautia sp. An249]|uniref:tubulin-like doman-containing protein n=1 Tax=Blautia sp. An249 TaxID=1965603 RepID=UPI0013A656EE|nr:tubulin-like doman-containing protein [Blautia sp. An249]
MLESLFIGNREGGIVNSITQVPQSSEPMVIIGLGGTGVDAVSRLKTKVHRQIEPDNENDVRSRGDEPRYDHIKFLGIDADSKWLERSGLTKEERLNIQNYNYKHIFSSLMLDGLKSQKEMQWMNVDYMLNHLPPTPDGTGAYRPFGRWLTIASANDIKRKLTQVITQACTERTGNSLNVHIVSSISGGMGAGSFVDVCYIAREVIDGLGFRGANVFGYFVLPDAIISKEEIIGDPVRRANNQRNGMASLLEIEHLMNLKDSHEWFEQDYGSFVIRTQEQLVDMCHFVSSTNMKGVPVSKGYEYALNVIGDYILAFISKEQVADGGKPVALAGIAAGMPWGLAGIDPEHGRGYSQNYHIIGSVNAEIPTTQMATYLATELFKKLTICTKMPDNDQIEQEFADYLKLSDSCFRELENQIAQGGSGWIQITEDLVKKYFDWIKANMNNGKFPYAMLAPTETSLKQRKALLIQNRGSMEKDVNTYVFQAGASSIPGLALNKLIELAEDPGKGPIYAYGMMNKSGVDIFHYLEGRLKYYTDQRQHARDQEALFASQEPDAKRKLGNSSFLNKSRNMKEYAAILNSMYHWQAQADLFEEMERLMKNLIEAFRSMNNRYLKPLYEITTELMETFEANRTYFQLGKGDQSQDGFTKQLVKFSQIQPELDMGIMKLNPVVETGGLLKILTTYPEIWMEREESKLKAKISEYVLRKFRPTLSGSLESFLRKNWNMEGTPAGNFANTIQQRIIEPLADAAAPIFWTDEPMVSDHTKTLHRTILTVPGTASCVWQAADQYKLSNDNWVEVRKAFIYDRLHILRIISGVPMHAYRGLVQYLGAYESYQESGLHLCENKPNWREILTFPYPYSLEPKYTRNAEELVKLYDDAAAKGIIYFEGATATTGGQAYVKQFKEMEGELFNVEDLKKDGRMDTERVSQRISELEGVLNSPVNAIPINSKGNLPGNTLVRDNFLRFYGIQQIVRREVEKFDSVKKAIAEIRGYMSDE